jgi:2'-5' RNA ligase
MATQLSLSGFAPPPPSRDSVFFAILPDEGAQEHIARLTAALRDEHAMSGKPTAKDRLHLSLHWLGDFAEVPPGVLAAADEAAAAVDMPPFEVAFDRVVSFGKGPNRPLVLVGDDGLAGSALFHQQLGAALASKGVRLPKQAFNPHVTLLYDKQMVGEKRAEPIRWRVSEFVLIHSLHGKGRHIRLGRWPLKDR